MTTPSKNFTPVTDSQIDADSPLDTTLVTSLRDSLVNIKEWLGNSYTAAVDHCHNGIDSKRVNDADIIKTNAVTMFDDFLDPNVSVWAKTGTVAVIVDIANGAAKLTPVSVGDGIMQTGRPWIIAGGTTVTFEARVRFNATLSTDAYAGLHQDTGAGNLIGIGRYSGNANWYCRTIKAGASTVTDSSVALATGQWYVVKIVATVSSVLFYIDGVLKATITTNIPVVNLGAGIMNFVAGASGGSIDVDYITCSLSGRM